MVIVVVVVDGKKEARYFALFSPLDILYQCFGNSLFFCLLLAYPLGFLDEIVVDCKICRNRSSFLLAYTSECVKSKLKPKESKGSNL